MPTRTDIRKILSQGLTGWEAGLLVFEDSWLVSHNEEGFLSDRDIELLKAGLKSQKDIQDYNTLIRLYRTADYIERQAYHGVFGASYFLERMTGLAYLEYAPLVAELALRSLPLVVTEKELRSLKAEQRKKLLQRYYCLDQVISWRAYALVPEEHKQGTEPECIGEDAPELYQQAEAEIQALVEAGKLEPVRREDQTSSGPLGEELEQDWIGDTTWTPEQKDKMLRTYFSGQQLYRAGLPEWRAWIDTFKLYELDKKHWLAKNPPESVAIVQEPDKHSLDRRGHFKKDFLRRWPLAPLPEEKFGAAKSVSGWIDVALREIRETLVRRQVLVELGQVLGLALEERIDYGIEAFLKWTLNRYNAYATDVSPELRKFPRGEKVSDEERKKALDEHVPSFKMTLAGMMRLELPTISLEKVRLPAEDITEIRSWISEVLGEDWWKQAGQTAKKPKSLLFKKETQDKLEMLREQNRQEAEDE